MRRLTSIAIVAVLALTAGSLRAEEEQKYDEVGIGPVVYQVPATWQRQRPANEMRAVQYGVPLAEGDKGKVEMIVFYFGGGGGSVKDNLDRWVGMFEDKKEKEKVDSFEADGMKVTTLDVTGTYKDKPFPFSQSFELRKDWRMLASVVETSDGPYFFRLVGPQKTVEAQSKHWAHMLKSAKKK